MGENFGKYELVEKIAQGGMAELFLARQQGDIGGFTKEVAIKRMFPHLAEEDGIIEMFLDEARIAASLTHPNIVQVYDLGVVNDHLYIAMEYVQGKDLRSVLERGFDEDNSLPLELAASIGAQLAAGLSYAHGKTDEQGNPMNIVHRDISPQNVLISMDGAVKICDFGIAKAEHRIGHTKAGQVKGKFSYMSPEQIESGEVDSRSDIFALGILLYETTTMSRLFSADNQYEALEKILYAQFPPPSSVRAGYPAELERIVMKALSRDPGSRHQTAEELQLELENWLVQNQASTSPVHVARYMRNLFGDPFKPKKDEAAATAEMPVSHDEIRANDARLAEQDETIIDPDFRDKAAAAAKAKSGKRSDVTDMDEEDLDAALDNALGAPGQGSADPFALQTPSEASDASEVAPKVAAAAAAAPVEKPASGPSVHEAETVVREKLTRDLDETAVVDQKAPAPAPAPAATAAPAQAVPAAAHVAPAPVPQPAPAAVPGASIAPAGPPPGGPPPSARSGSIPVTGPPGRAAVPGGASSQEARARAALEPDRPEPSPADLSADFGDVSDFKTGGKKGVLALVAIVLALIGIGVVVLVSLDTSDSTISKEMEEQRIDPAMLEVQPTEPMARVQAAVEIAPAGASVLVNGLPVEVQDGKISITQGVKNEIAVYAEGHYPQRAYLDGEASTSPVAITLEPATAPAPETTADLQIVTEPRDALVFVDGKQIGMSPTLVQGLDTSFEHHVYIKKDGRFSYSGLIGLVPKSENVVDVTLHEHDSARKNYVEVVFAALPRGAIVTVDGEQVGSTKSFKNYDRNKHLTVEFTEPDSAPARYYVQLEEVGVMELRPFLKPMTREKGTISISVVPEGPELYVGPNAYGAGPAENLSFPMGNVKVVLDSPATGRGEAAVEVVPNTHTNYVLSIDSDGKVTVAKQ